MACVMVIIEHGVISNGGIALDKPVPLPDGSKVVVQIETAAPDDSSQQDDEAVQALKAAFPFVGQWADRDDMADSAAYVREHRAKWQQRPYRQD
jgi:hypothetical protein